MVEVVDGSKMAGMKSASLEIICAQAQAAYLELDGTQAAHACSKSCAAEGVTEKVGYSPEVVQCNGLLAAVLVPQFSPALHCPMPDLISYWQ